MAGLFAKDGKIGRIGIADATGRTVVIGFVVVIGTIGITGIIVITVITG